MVVLDEPFVDLDTHGLSIIRAIIKMLGEIKTVVISAKNSADLSGICDDILTLASKQPESEIGLDAEEDEEEEEEDNE